MRKKYYILKDFLILAEKQRTKPWNLTFHENLASFDTLVDPEAAKVKNEMLLRAFKPVCFKYPIILLCGIILLECPKKFECTLVRCHLKLPYLRQ